MSHIWTQIIVCQGSKTTWSNSVSISNGGYFTIQLQHKTLFQSPLQSQFSQGFYTQKQFLILNYSKFSPGLQIYLSCSAAVLLNMSLGFFKFSGTG